MEKTTKRDGVLIVASKLDFDVVVDELREGLKEVVIEICPMPVDPILEGAHNPHLDRQSDLLLELFVRHQQEFRLFHVKRAGPILRQFEQREERERRRKRKKRNEIFEGVC